MIFVALAVAGAGFASAQTEDGPSFPVTPEIFVDEPFASAEGITFNAEGRMFVSANKAVWEVGLDRSARKLFDTDSNLGLAAYGERDILVADFGPTNAFQDDRNADGVVWLSTPEGEKVAFATGIGDPNAIVVRDDGSLLVSDDATADIYLVSPEGKVSLFSTAVSHPNGMVLSHDKRTLYVARIFHSIRPVVFDNTVWAIRLNDDGTPRRVEAKVVFRTGPDGTTDGMAIDVEGRLYVSSPRTGKIWRYDPESEETILIADGMPGVAGLTFGRGAFDPTSIYAVALYSGGLGGKVYRIPVGVEGRN